MIASHNDLFSHSRESFPDYIKNRLQFRYHVYRSLYFLEQGSVKGVKKEVKASSDFYLLFSEEVEEDYEDHIEESFKLKGSLGSIALDSYETMTSFDGYLPPLLKSRLEYRRGNCMKILSLLNQIYEEEEEEEENGECDDTNMNMNMNMNMNTNTNTNDKGEVNVLETKGRGRKEGGGEEEEGEEEGEEGLKKRGMVEKGKQMTTTAMFPLTPSKDHFYYTMMASVYFASNLYSLSIHYLGLAIEVCK